MSYSRPETRAGGAVILRGVDAVLGQDNGAALQVDHQAQQAGSVTGQIDNLHAGGQFEILVHHVVLPDRLVHVALYVAAMGGGVGVLVDHGQGLFKIVGGHIHVGVVKKVEPARVVQMQVGDNHGADVLRLYPAQGELPVQPLLRLLVEGVNLLEIDGPIALHSRGIAAGVKENVARLSLNEEGHDRELNPLVTHLGVAAGPHRGSAEHVVLVGLKVAGIEYVQLLRVHKIPP